MFEHMFCNDKIELFGKDITGDIKFGKIHGSIMPYTAFLEHREGTGGNFQNAERLQRH